jgi:trimethylamine:corrinoid methyltransferase-like protein
MTRIFDGPAFFNVASREGIDAAEQYLRDGHYVITMHSVFESPLLFTLPEKLEVFVECVERQIPVMLVTMPFSGQNAPMTPYGLAVIAFAEFLAAMALAYSINPLTKVVNGSFPTMCTPGRSPELKLGSVVHNIVNYLIAYTSRLLDIASIQSGCTIEGSVHEKAILETDYQTVRAMILWENMFEGWHMVRHCYGFLADLAGFSFEKAIDDITALRHIQSLDDNGIAAILANNVRLNRDYNRAEEIYQRPTLIFAREQDTLLEVILETVENFGGDFGRHEHTLKNIPSDWF